MIGKVIGSIIVMTLAIFIIPVQVLYMVYRKHADGRTKRGVHPYHCRCEECIRAGRAHVRTKP